MFRLPGLGVELPAVAVNREPTTADNAWSPQGYWTVRLLDTVSALRVHARAGAAASTKEHLAWGAGRRGRWFAIGDVILTREEYRRVHALPAGFSHQDDWSLPANTVLNVGIAGPLFGQAGGALQAEWLTGPEPSSQPIQGYWGSRSGSA